MKNFLTLAIILLCSLSVYSQSLRHHSFNFSVLVYAQRLDEIPVGATVIKYTEVSHTLGLSVQLDHFIESIPTVGTRTTLDADLNEDIILSFTPLVLRFPVLKDFITIEVLATTLTYDFKRRIIFGKPIGIGFQIGKKNLRAYVTELIGYDTSFQTRIALKYIF